MILFKEYSIVSSNKDKLLEFYIYNRKQGLSNLLFHLNVNDIIYNSCNAYGDFLIDNIPKNNILWMIGAGTAIAPFLSILTSNRKLILFKFKKIILVNLVRYYSDLNYKNRIFYIKNLYPKNFFICINIVSREHIEYHNYDFFIISGRIYSLLLNGYLENLINVQINNKSNYFMICGNIVMIDNICLLLKNKFNLIRGQHIFVEGY